MEIRGNKARRAAGGTLKKFSTIYVENSIYFSTWFSTPCGKLHHCGKLCGKCEKVFPKSCGKVGVWKILGKTLWKTP
jgi:hypothetical protein